MSTDPLPNVGNDLARIHKVITRALDVSLQNSQGTDLANKHQQGFVSYVRALTILLHSHHAVEDELAFPFWQTRLPSGPFDELRSQHRQMTAHVERIERWTGAGPEAWGPDSLSKLQQTLADLQTFWRTHIALEEATIGPANSGTYLTPSENEQLGRELLEHAQAHTQPSELVIPFIVYNLSGEDRAQFLRPLPPVMAKQLIPVTWKAVWAPIAPFLLSE